MSRVALMIMAKAPQPGAVKTRLCPPLDAHHAARLYECFLRDKIEAVRSIDGTQPAIAYTPSGAERLFRELAPDFSCSCNKETTSAAGWLMRLTGCSMRATQELWL